jgi:8-oxo-dGTP pyrophosphatase MutT (NUDIX family)
MHDDELWQRFNDNGAPLVGIGASADEFKAHPEYIMGNSHVWFWKKSGENVEVLLQKRSLTKTSKPGWYHISAGGHINVGETPLEAVLREANEEMGIELDADNTHYSFSTRIIGRAPNDIVNVFLYELNGTEGFTYIDGEVDSYEWRTLEEFNEITKDPEANNLINQGTLYFSSLIASINYVANGLNELH